MNTELYVGNLPLSITESALRGLFEQHGPVQDVHIHLDRAGREPRRFAFVKMATPEGAAAAIFGVGGREVEGHELRVYHSRPPGERAANSTGDRGGRGGPRGEFSNRRY